LVGIIIGFVVVVKFLKFGFWFWVGGFEWLMGSVFRK